MASQADRVLRNFRWRIESTAPTHQRPRKPFRWMDLAQMDPDNHPALRLFQVRWLGEGQDDGDSVTDLAERRALHRYGIEVFYAADYDLEVIQEIILQDRHDLLKTLRDPRLFVGTGSGDSTSDVGLQARRSVGIRTDFDDEERSIILRLEYECEIWETE
jgi:hypothetical protein